jgi:iron-only hydrogenase group A
VADKNQGNIKIDIELCTGCRRCAEVCPVDAIEGNDGSSQSINIDKCVMCGQCIQICSAYASVFEEYPTSREKKLLERNLPETLTEPLFAAYSIGDLPKVKEALANSAKFTMVQCAPAVRVSIAEEFGMPLGSLVPGKLAAALRQLGFNKIYDTNFAADLTIMEEGSELVQRITEGGTLPMFTSCCPAWVKFVEREYPELIPHLSSCKSPQQMAGTMFKTYGAEKDSIEPENIFSIAIMPCTCKKFEAERPEMNTSGYQDVDAVLTVRELAYLIKEVGIDFNSLLESSFDKPLSMYSGAGHLFCATGGVMEAAIRTAYEMITEEPISDVNIQYVRGGQGIRRGVVKAGDLKVKTVVVSGLKNVVPILEEIKQGDADFHFMEVMTCPVGCVSGGGQPKMLLPKDNDISFKNRISSTYRHYEDQIYRKSHENPEIKAIYQKFLGEPLGQKSHHLLHTEYTPRREGK